MPIPTGISGSRAAAILGLSKYETPFSVWQSIMEQRHGEGWNAKQGYSYEPFEGNTATEFGHAFESAIISLTENHTGHTITDREAVHNVEDYITCHIDGIINNGLFEGKSANFRAYQGDWGEPGTDRIPVAYACQIQHNLMCAGLTEATMSVLVFPSTVQDWEKLGWQAHHDQFNGVHFLKNHETDQIIDPLTWAKTFAEIGNFHIYEIEARPNTQKLLKEMYSDFWNKYVVPCVAPDAVDYDDIRRQFTSPKGTLVISEKDRFAGEDVADIMREYKNITAEIGASGHLQKRKKFIKTQILKFAREQTTVEDEESIERVLFLDESGKRLGSFNKKGFRS